VNNFQKSIGGADEWDDWGVGEIEGWDEGIVRIWKVKLQAKLSAMQLSCTASRKSQWI
jgi:hypothetical protein